MKADRLTTKQLWKITLYCECAYTPYPSETYWDTGRYDHVRIPEVFIETQETLHTLTETEQEAHQTAALFMESEKPSATCNCSAYHEYDLSPSY